MPSKDVDLAVQQFVMADMGLLKSEYFIASLVIL